MMTDANIIDVNDETFDFEVLNYSTRIPVVMDFWAPWCIPCRVQSPLLARLALEADGAFRLARVNVDEQLKLAERLKVRNVPMVKAFVDGHIVSEFSGVLSEQNLRAFIAHLMPDTGDLLLEKGKSLMIQGDLENAEESLRQYLSTNSNNPAGLLAFARVLLFQGKGKDADRLLAAFPASHEFSIAENLRPVAKAYTWIATDPEESNDGLELAYRRGLLLAKRGNILAALDGFLDIMRKNKMYRDNEVRDVYLGLLELLGENHPEVRQYRSDLSNILF